jgi:hypothetical protein
MKGEFNEDIESHKENPNRNSGNKKLLKSNKNYS